MARTMGVHSSAFCDPLGRERSACWLLWCPGPYEAETMPQQLRALARIVIGTVIFLIWLQLVGNPHVVETILGVVVGVAGGWWFGQFLPKPKDSHAVDH